jgi:Flp pilus assembly protein TadB
MAAIIIVSFFIVIGMLGLLIWVLNKAYSRKDE